MDIKGEYGELQYDPYGHHHIPSAGSSGSGVRQDSAGAEAGFKCEHPGCQKTFTRKVSPFARIIRAGVVTKHREAKC